MTELLLANAAVALAAFLQAASGIGFALVAVPLLAYIDPMLVPGPQLVAMLALSSWMVARGHSHIDTGGLSWIAAPMIAGTLLAIVIMRTIDVQVLNLVFAVVVLLTILAITLGLRVPRTRLTLMGGGAAAGAMGTMTGMHGPPLVPIYASSEPVVARTTIAAIFIWGVVCSLVGLWSGGFFGLEQFLLGLAMLPGVFLGYLGYSTIGERIISPAASRRLMLLIAGISALLLAASSQNWL